MKKDHNENVIVAFDVDGTLISEVDDSPRYDVIAMFKYFQSIGCYMIIWSGNGTDYAGMIARKLGLKATILVKGSCKPDLVFDDMETAMGKVAIQV